MVMAIGIGKSGSIESGGRWCGSSVVVIVVVISVLVRAVVVVFLLAVAVATAMPPCFWWGRGCRSPPCLWWAGPAAPHPPQPTSARAPQPFHRFPNPFHMDLNLGNHAALIFSSLQRVVQCRCSIFTCHGRLARSG